MARRTWTPDNATATQKAALRALDRALATQAKLEEKARQGIEEAIKTAREAGIPARFLATHMDKGRTTLYRTSDAVKKERTDG